MNIKAWIEAMRLRTLPVSMAGVLAGWGCAAHFHSFAWPQALICLLFALLAQIASNFANEYYDFKKGLDHKGREGFRRGVTEGDISPKAMERATFILLILDSLIGLSLVYWGGWWLLPIGIAIAVFALAYSAGPYPLSHHGLGEVAVVIFFGLVPVTLTAWLQVLSNEVFPLAIPISIAIGLAGANVIIVNNYRDVEDDKAVNKRTTAVLFGRKIMSTIYLFNGVAALLIIEMATASFTGPWWQTGLLLYLILHIILYRQLTSRLGAALNPILGKTAMALFILSVYLLVMLIFTA